MSQPNNSSRDIAYDPSEINKRLQTRQDGGEPSLFFNFSAATPIKSIVVNEQTPIPQEDCVTSQSVVDEITTPSVDEVIVTPPVGEVIVTPPVGEVIVTPPVGESVADEPYTFSSEQDMYEEKIPEVVLSEPHVELPESAAGETTNVQVLSEEVEGKESNTVTKDIACSFSVSIQDGAAQIAKSAKPKALNGVSVSITPQANEQLVEEVAAADVIEMPSSPIEKIDDVKAYYAQERKTSQDLEVKTFSCTPIPLMTLNDIHRRDITTTLKRRRRKLFGSTTFAVAEHNTPDTLHCAQPMSISISN